MNITSSYKVKIVGMNNMFRLTEQIYNQAVTFFIGVINNEWEYVKPIMDSTKYIQPTSIVEELTLVTKNRPVVKYDFNAMFYGMPSYLRRSAITKAYGIVKSYRSNHNNWVKDGKKGGEPRLKYKHHTMPVFFRNNMYTEGETRNTANLKIYDGSSWKWITVKLRNQDIKYIDKYWTGIKCTAPTLEKRGKARYLRFAFTEKQELNTTPIQNQVVIAVDLGINNNAVCSAMLADGTVVGRKFINLSTEKDQMYHLLNKLKKKQRKYGYRGISKIWGKINRVNDNMSRMTAKEIIDFATLYDADIIVFEYLDFNKKARGSKKQRLALWQKRTIQQIVTHKAHLQGVHVVRVNPYNTSRLAYDGTGYVKRGTYTQNGESKYNYSVCVFSTGKTYHCDLNASYNIGARYFIREIIKPLSVTVVSQIEAKVPHIVHRTHSTLSTLVSLNAELDNLAVT